jgi:hypothetical protein
MWVKRYNVAMTRANATSSRLTCWEQPSGLRGDCLGWRALRRATRALALVVLLAGLVPVRGFADDRLDARVAALLRSAEEHRRNDNAMRTRLAYVQALQLDPTSKPALIGLLSVVDAGLRANLALAARLRWPDDPQIQALGVPAPNRQGPAVELRLAYLGCSAATMPDGRMASIDAGQAIDPRLLFAAGVDRLGAPVPVELVLAAGDGFSERDGAVVAGVARAQARCLVRDPQHALDGAISLRIVGPPAEITVTAHSRVVGRGGLLHLQAGIRDAAGGRLWVRELRWQATSSDDRDVTASTLRDQVSRVPADIPFEPHRNVVNGPAGDNAYLGQLRVTASTVDGPVSAPVQVELIDREHHDAGLAGADLGWVAWDEALEAARKQGKPIMAFFLGEW